MRDSIISALRKERGYLWVDHDLQKKLLIWDGPNNKGVFLTAGDEVYFKLDATLPKKRFVYFETRKVRSTLIPVVEKGMLVAFHSLHPLDEKLRGDMDEKTRAWLMRVRL